MKKCSRCSEEKELGEFQIRSASNDGLTAACKSCLCEYDRRRASLPHRIELRMGYSKTEAGIEAHAKAKAKWSARNTIKRAANVMLGNALRDGKIVKDNECSACGGSNCTIHGHHDDYSLPLVVRWLCSKCHTQWHKHNGEGINA